MSIDRHVPEALSAIAEDVRAGRTPPPRETVRTLLSYFHAQRRGVNVEAHIRRVLKHLNVQTAPDFGAVHIDTEVEFRPIPAPTPQNAAAGAAAAAAGAADDSEAPSTEASLTVGMLASRERNPVTVTRDAPIAQACTLMLTNDYSQLPVVNGKQIVGVFSWKTLGEARTLGRPCEFVRDCMSKDPLVLDEGRPLLDAVEQIALHEVAVILDSSRSLIGVVTTTDLSERFHDLARAYLLLGSIETQLRALLRVFPLDLLRKAAGGRSDGAPDREIEDISNLTFGDYVALLQSPEGWEQFSTPLDRAIFVKLLDEVREIRNEVMHFHPDPVGELEFEKLSNALRTLRQVSASKGSLK